jgi:hypothetical protein
VQELELGQLLEEREIGAPLELERANAARPNLGDDLRRLHVAGHDPEPTGVEQPPMTRKVRIEPAPLVEAAHAPAGSLGCRFTSEGEPNAARAG